MSTSINRSSSVPRPYIGSHRNRHYIYNKLPSTSLLSNDYFLSSKSSKKPGIYGSIDTPSESLQDRNAKEFLSSSNPLADRQFYQGRKTRDFLSTSSLFLFPSTQNKASRLCHDPCSSSFVKEQQKVPSNHYYESRHSYCQPTTTDNKNHLYQSSTKPHSVDNYQFDRNNPFLSSSLSSASLINESILVNKKNENSFHLSSLSLHQPKTTEPLFTLSSSNKNNENKYVSKISNNRLDRSSSSSSRYSTDPWNINSTMSSSKYPTTGSDSYTGPVTHSYDQRISDQGNKYVIQLTTDDFEEKEFTITPYFSRYQLVIDGKHIEEDNFGGFIRRELHKIFPIPKHIDINKYSYSYNRKARELTIEMPYLHSITNEKKIDSSFIPSIQSSTFSYGDMNLSNDGRTIHSRSDLHHNLPINSNGINTRFTDPSKTPVTITSKNDSSIGKNKPFDFDVFHRSAFRPQILPGPSTENNSEKKLLMSLDLTDYQPEDIQVSIKDQELIVKAERKIETDTRKSRTSFFQSTSLPPQTDIERLQSNYLDGKLIIEAPYLEKHVKVNHNIDINGETMIRSERKSTDEDPYQQRTETVIEFIRRRRL